MLGFWDYTVILTYASFASACAGIFCAVSMHLHWAIFFLAICGFCDMFDGKIARTKKNRTDDEKSFGIQIDSLCDMVCFGVLPVVICYKAGMNRLYSLPVLIFYGLAGLVRLAYFNVMEEKRQAQTQDDRKYYQGLPITSMSVALPALFVATPVFANRGLFLGVMHLLVLAVGILFITDFKLRKPATREVVLLVCAVALAVLVLVFVGNKIKTRKHPRIDPNTEPMDMQTIDQDQEYAIQWEVTDHVYSS